jgi:hypothetical protein
MGPRLDFTGLRNVWSGLYVSCPVGGCKTSRKADTTSLLKGKKIMGAVIRASELANTSPCRAPALEQLELC